MSANFQLNVCENLRHEAEAVLMTENFTEVKLSVTSATCFKSHADQLHIQPGSDGKAPAEISCGMLNSLVKCLNNNPPCGRQDMDLCFSALVNREFMKTLLEQGCWLISPGWLAGWKIHMRAWGFNLITAREFFAKSTKRIVLLDTQVNAASRDQLAELASYVERPFEIIPIGLDFMRQFVRNLVFDWQLKDRNAEAQAASQDMRRMLSNQIMAFDLVARLSSMKSEEQAILGIAEMFTILFAPKNICYVPMFDGKPGPGALFPNDREPDPSLIARMITLRENYRWDGGDSFALRIGSPEETLGIVEVSGFSFPQHRQQYLNFALGLAGVCALTIRSARAYERLQKTIRERENLAAELARKHRELESVLYAASHDLRSPLVNIQGFGKRLEISCKQLGGLLDRPDVPDTLREQSAPMIHEQIPKSMGFIHASIARMEAIIGGMLAISRLGRVVLRLENLDMNRLLTLCLASMKFQIEESGAIIDMKSPLPDCQGDSTLLSQVFSNLLDNAVKYRASERRLNISISGVIEDGMAIYCVADNGIGITLQQCERIWELFCRLNPNGPVPGEGLGLNLVRRIVERHGGRVWVESSGSSSNDASVHGAGGSGNRQTGGLPHEEERHCHCGEGSCFFVASPRIAVQTVAT